jgi:predicted HicB family RNase H-like nuclease
LPQDDTYASGGLREIFYMTFSKMERWTSLMVEYRDYIGCFAFDEKKKIFYGRVVNIHGLITFDGKSAKETKKAFRETINEYINRCKKFGKPPEKPFSMVRLKP